MVLTLNPQVMTVLKFIIINNRSLPLSPFIQHVDEAVNSQLKERYQDKISKLQKGEKKVFEDMFAYACPKFISPIPPDYDSLPENYNKVGTDVDTKQE